MQNVVSISHLRSYCFVFFVVFRLEFRSQPLNYIDITPSDFIYRKVSERLRSFDSSTCNWNVCVEKLSEAGFYFVGPRDKVQCSFCLGKLLDWQKGDSPMFEHFKHFPHCVIVCKNLNTIYQPLLSLFDIRIPMTLRFMADMLSTSDADKTRVESDCAMEVQDGTCRAQSDSVTEEAQGDQTMLCKICFDRYIDIIIIPCRHAQICSICSKKIDKCVTCRQPIVATLDIYL